MKVALVGVTGYAGMVLYQLLKSHPAVDQINLYGHDLDHAVPLYEAVPQFGPTEMTPLHPYDPAAIQAANDVLFFATSAGVTNTLAAPFIAAHFPVIDLSGDYRLKDPAQYTKWYHKTPAPQAALATAHFGLADFANAKGQTYVANPGCYATATLLGVAPLIQQHLIVKDSLIVDAKSGTSGAGKKLTTMTHFTQTNENLQLYGINTHKHIPEIMQAIHQWDPAIPALQFSTTLLPITTGLMATIYAKVAPGVDGAAIAEAYAQTYQDDFFVRFTGEQLPTLKQVVGSNFTDIGAVYNPVTNTVMVVSVIDNMIKGAGGQAIQNFNQMFGFDESAGLPTTVALP
ncbi:N-acetyl-gamma-glutamyl-phosphate reductase [Lacticaseibacillus baoqingensis]|uniref:N-acetyl-gamma-glutamyl-phosphate reductase n=1 Tax=Lacticaseibacillus baoqingensis TaxID=2486013 RepID=A0ABW4E443_9LACO|nr:N-acetyl-gamma-glutamyl-phosphate reductase [Lacticaseibacillus baoqingensis]